MVWGDIFTAGRTQLVIINGNLNGQRYRDEILDPVAIPYIKGIRGILQDDNARPHRARIIITDYLQQRGVQRIEWPACTTDWVPARTSIPLNTCGTRWVGLSAIKWQIPPHWEICDSFWLKSGTPSLGNASSGWYTVWGGDVRLLLSFTVDLHAIEHVILCIKPLKFYFVLISVPIRIKYDVLQEWYFSSRKTGMFWVSEPKWNIRCFGV